MRLSATVPLLALGSVSLVVIAVPGSTSSAAAPHAVAQCNHAAPSVSAKDAQRLSQRTSASDPRPLGQALGDGVRAALVSLESVDATGRPASGLPYGLSAGVIGVLGTEQTGYKVVVDGTVEQDRYQAAVRRYVPPAGRPMLAVERSCRSAESIAASWRAVGARSWSADARSTTFVADVDPATENVVVEYDQATTSASSASGLRSLEGVSARVGGVARMSRLNDTPKGGHWGGARITSALKNCSAGFSVVRRSNNTRGSVTAGHCGGVGTVWRSGSHYYGTTSVRSDYPDYDQALLTGSSYGAKIWTDGPSESVSTRTVKGGGDPAIGASVCQSGSFSTAVCGIIVRSLSAKYCDTDGCTTYVIRATRGGQTAIIGGDSGGPVYSRPTSTTATIRGTTFAGSGCTRGRCTTLYAERYNSITGHLGVTALTG